MFASISLDDAREISFVVLQGYAVSLGDECFNLWKAIFVLSSQSYT